jgi:hypothetical protein
MIGKEQKTSIGNLKLGDLPDDECKYTTEQPTAAFIMTMHTQLVTQLTLVAT